MLRLERGEAFVKLKKPNLTNNLEQKCMNANITSTSGYQAGSISPKKDINLKSYNKICIKYSANLNRHNSASCIDFFGNNLEYSIHLCYKEAVSTTIPIDISAHTADDFYIFLQSDQSDGSANINIYEVWLEK